MIRGAGHYVFADQPEDFNQTILQILAKMESGRKGGEEGLEGDGDEGGEDQVEVESKQEELPDPEDETETTDQWLTVWRDLNSVTMNLCCLSYVILMHRTLNTVIGSIGENLVSLYSPVLHCVRLTDHGFDDVTGLSSRVASVSMIRLV